MHGTRVVPRGGDEAPRGFGSGAYSHRLIGCDSHAEGTEMDDDEGAALPSVVYFCRCHEGPGEPELRQQMASLHFSDLRRRLRNPGALKPVLVPLQLGDWEKMTGSQQKTNGRRGGTRSHASC